MHRCAFARHAGFHKYSRARSLVGEFGDPGRMLVLRFKFLRQIAPITISRKASRLSGSFLSHSTNDDRFIRAARNLRATGRFRPDFLYYENIDGGHFRCGRNLKETAQRSRYQMSICWSKLADLGLAPSAGDANIASVP